MSERSSDIIQFIRKLYPDRSDIPLHAPLLRAGEHLKIDPSDHPVNDFEKAIGEITGAPYVVATSSGTSALHLGLLAVGVIPGDLVITIPFSYVATVHAILYCNASPLYCDIDERTLGLNPENVQALLERECVVRGHECFHKATGRRVSACLTVYNYGLPYPAHQIHELCKRWYIAVVEDAAEAMGTTIQGAHAGLSGDCGIISFNRNKTITTGGGGAILTQSGEIADIIRKLLNHSRTIDGNFQYKFSAIGFNYSMPFVNASLGLQQVAKFADILDRKTRLKQLYVEFFQKTGLTTISVDPGTQPNHWLNLVCFPDATERNDFVGQAKAESIDVRPGWTLLNRFKHLEGIASESFPIATHFQNTLVALPSSPDFSE